MYILKNTGHTIYNIKLLHFEFDSIYLKKV